MLSERIFLVQIERKGQKNCYQLNEGADSKFNLQFSAQILTKCIKIQFCKVQIKGILRNQIQSFSKQISENMEILRSIQKQTPLSPAMQVFFIHFPQLQLLYLFFVNLDIPFYNQVLDIVKVESIFVMHILVIAQLCARTFLVTILGLKYFGIVKKKYALEVLVLKFLKVKIKILIVISLNWNTLAYKYCESPYTYIALFNLVVTIGQLLATRILNSSFRFEEQNLICQKNTSLLSSMLLFPIIYLLDYYDLFYASCLIIFRCFVQIYFNFNNVENHAIQYCEYFSPLVMMSFCIIEIISHFSGVQLMDSQNIIFFMVIFLFSLYSAHSLTETLMVLAPKYHLKRCSYFTKNQDEQSFLQNQGTTSFNQDEQQDFVIALRVLAKVFVTKQKAEGLFHLKQNPYHPSILNQEQFNSWWQQFNRIIINHRVFCAKVTCQCQKIVKMGTSNDTIASKVFLQIIFNSLQKVISCTNSTKLSIIEKYFYLELLQRPIKNYYQLIKLQGQIKKSQEILEVESLMYETREMFGHLINREKAQNQHLQVDLLLKFQYELGDIKVLFIELANHYKKFYDLFSNSYVELPTLKKLTLNLTSTKNKIAQQLDKHMQKFSRNLQFLSYCLIYYKCFDEYTDNIQKIQSKISTLNELSQTQQAGHQINKKNVDVFNPIYGAIKIDLVWRAGQIVSVTKNICALLGFKKDQVEGQKINKIMPYIFGRYHDRFLRNFVERGSLGMLKYKERIFYARNNQKFIFPITVRLKVEYLSSQGFFANSLIKKTSTKSQFILLNNYGKIEQISQSIYRLLFQKSFKDQVSKVKRINIFKMLLSLNHFVKHPEEIDERIYEGIITTVDEQQVLQSYYKLLEFGIDKTKKRVENSNTDTSEDIISNRSQKGSKTFMGSESFGMQQEVKSSQCSFNAEKCKNDMKEMLKDFFSKININKIKAYKVSYKFYDLVTSEFTCKVLQIINIHDQIPTSVVKLQLPKEIVQIAQLYGLGQDQMKKFRKLQEYQDQGDIQKQTGNIISLKKYRSLEVKEEQTLMFTDGQDKLQQGKEIQNYKDLQRCGSVSSMNSNSEKLQRKSTIMTSFDLKSNINQKLEQIIKILNILVAASLILICVFSITLKSDYKKLEQDNLIIKNFKINFDFHLALQQLQTFYTQFDIHPPNFIEQKKNLLTDNMKQQLLNSIDWIDNQISGQLYFDPIVLKHAESRFEESRPIISSLNKFYSIFLMDKDHSNDLSDNYRAIRGDLEKLADKEKQSIINASSWFRIKIHVVIGVYSFVLLFITVMFIVINYTSKLKEQKIIDFLPFVSVKQVRQKTAFYEQMIDYLKDTQEIKMEQIEVIDMECGIEAQRQKRRHENKSEKKMLGRVFSKSKEQGVIQSKLDSSSRFIRVVKGEQKNLTYKNCVILILLVGVCGAVIISTEYYFGQAHNKFTAYIQLKQTAMMIQNLAPKTLLTYLININKRTRFQQTVPFPDYYYNSPVQQLFNLRQKLALKQNNGTELANALNTHLNHRICQLIHCTPDDLIANQTDVYFLTYRFINALEYMRKTMPNVFPVSNQPKQQVKKWIQQGNIEKLLQSIEHVFQLMTKNQQEVTVLFSQQISLIGYSLLYLSLTLIPLLILSLYFIRQKFTQFVYGRLSSIESVFKQFAWSILAENTYAVNYFENKLRNSKKY